MYPPRFRYEAPRSLDEAVALLGTYGDDAKVLAGGQSLVPLLKLRFAAPQVLVDINNLPGLGYHREHATARCASARCAATATSSGPTCSRASSPRWPPPPR